MELVVDKEIGQTIASVELKQNNKIGIKEAVGSTFWQKLSQKPPNYLQHHGVLSKLNLSDFYYPRVEFRTNKKTLYFSV